MNTGTAELLQGRSHSFIRYVQQFKAATRELRLLKIGLAITLSACLLMVVLLGKMSEAPVAGTGRGERMALIFAISFFVFYKWRERRHTESLSDIETDLHPEERVAVRLAVPTEG